MVRLQYFWIFIECEVPFYCHRSQVYTHLVVTFDRVLSLGQIELFDI